MKARLIVNRIENIKNKETISKISLFILLLFILIQKILFVPINVNISQITFNSLNIGADKLSVIENILPNILYFASIFSTLFFLVEILIYTLILKFLFTLFKITNIDYKHLFQVIIYASFILIFGEYINTFILYLQEIENINSQLDTYKLGINLLFDYKKLDWSLYTFLSNINICQFAYCIFIIYSLKILTHMNYRVLITIVFIYWILTTTIPIIFSKISMILTQNALLYQ